MNKTVLVFAFTTTLCLSLAKFSEGASPDSKIVSYNVWYGFTKVPQRKEAFTKWMIEQNPDVVVLQELNTYTDDQLATDANAWGHNHQVLSPLDRTFYEQTPELVEFFDNRDQTLGEKNLENHQLHFSVMQRFADEGFVHVIHSQRLSTKPPFGTFPTKLRSDEDHGSERRLDYILCSPNLAQRCRVAGSIHNRDTDMLSDHDPVFAEFGVE